VATFNLSLSDELGACTEDLYSEIPVVAAAAERGAARFSPELVKVNVTLRLTVSQSVSQ
jgi:hypothetical protein